MLYQAIVAVSDLTWSASFCLIPIFLNFWGSASPDFEDSHLPEFEDADQLFTDLQITGNWGNFQCCGAGAGGAEIILRGWSRYRSRNYLFQAQLRSSGAEIIILLLAILLYCRQFGGCHCQDELRLISDQLSAVYSYFFCSTVFILLLSGNSGPELELEPEPK